MGQVHNLSPQILASLAEDINKPYGGFTVKSHGPDAGKPAKDSYMVGLAKHGQNDMPLDITAEQISDFADSRGDALADPSNYLGGFNDTDKGNRGRNPGSLDVSRAFPRSKGEFPAMMQARWGGARPEDSVGVTDEHGEFSHAIPTYDPLRAFGGVHAFDREE
jgi:hypothetical protein